MALRDKIDIKLVIRVILKFSPECGSKIGFCFRSCLKHACMNIVISLSEIIIGKFFLKLTPLNMKPYRIEKWVEEKGESK